MSRPVESARWALLAAGISALALAVTLDRLRAGSAVDQDWPPFVLVAGLLLIGRVAGEDGLFDAAGAVMARTARGGFSLLAGAGVVVAAVTAVLNLDTSVAFLTPVLVVAARKHGVDEDPYLYLALLLSNGASLLLTGSNLTNLIVLGSRHISSAAFALHMLPAWVAASVSVPLVVALAYRRTLRRRMNPPPAGRSPAGTSSPDAPPLAVPAHAVTPDPGRLPARADGGHLPGDRPLVVGAGALAVLVALVAMVVLDAGPMALVVVGSGLAVVGWRSWGRRTSAGAGIADAGREVRRSVDVPVLGGLFGVAVGLGTLGRAWGWPASLLAHASSWAAAGLGALTSVLVNNLPAASLLAARPVPDPYALLVGLNLGPNLAVSGSLAAVLWLQVSRTVGARPSALRVSKLGVVVAPLSMAAALGMLAALH